MVRIDVDVLDDRFRSIDTALYGIGVNAFYEELHGGLLLADLFFSYVFCDAGADKDS